MFYRRMYLFRIIIFHKLINNKYKWLKILCVVFNCMMWKIRLENVWSIWGHLTGKALYVILSTLLSVETPCGLLGSYKHFGETLPLSSVLKFTWRHIFRALKTSNLTSCFTLLVISRYPGFVNWTFIPDRRINYCIRNFCP